MAITTSCRGDIWFVRPLSDIRVGMVVELRKVLEEVAAGRPKRVAIDLGTVGFIDSSGVGLLVNFAKRLKKAGGTLVLANYADDLGELLEMTGLDRLVVMHKTLDESVP